MKKKSQPKAKRKINFPKRKEEGKGGRKGRSFEEVEKNRGRRGKGKAAEKHTNN